MIQLIQVLVHMDKTEIPQRNIKHRWTKLAGPQGASCGSEMVAQIVTTRMDETKRQALVMRALELAQQSGPIDEAAYADAMRAIESCGRRRDTAACEVNNKEVDVAVPSPSLADKNFPIACPPRPPRCGRPRDTSLKT